VTIAELPALWRADAATLRKYGATSQGQLLDDCAAEVEASLRQQELELLTLERAERESGYSYSALQKMVANGRLANMGEKGSPLIRRCDLPKKGGAHRNGIAHVALLARAS
jgi:hypothetical protein